jgi:glycosyltransferase involved in cell wall biosynthesis
VGVKRLLFIVSEDWYFVSHRLHMGKAAARAGYRVGVVTRVAQHRKQIEEAGIDVIDWNLNRSSRNPFSELQAIAHLISAMRRFRPDLIHAVALKPVLYASLASRIVGPRRRVFALGGLGFVFASRRLLARLLRPLVIAAFRLELAGEKTLLILQNPEDVAVLTAARVIPGTRVHLIRGAGVDASVFRPQPEQDGPPLVILPARMLWDKGIADFVGCARALRSRGVAASFALVGERDPHNPECVSQEQLTQWVETGCVEWWGRCEDMPAVYARAHVVCLPSYHEGLPKVLLEAASCARPIVAYDIAGCREVVADGRNGILVPFRDTERLAQAINELLSNAELRRAMGAAGRERVLREFTQEGVAAETARVWAEALA